MNLVDLGKIYRDAEAVKASRLRTQALQTKMNQRETLQKERAAYMGGDKAALDRMTVIAPEEAASFSEQLQRLEAPEIARIQKSNEAMAKLAAFILNKPEGEREAIFNEFLPSLSPEIQKRYSSGYNERKLQFDLAKMYEVDQILSMAKDQRQHNNAIAQERVKQEGRVDLENVKSGNAIKLAEKRGEIGADADERKFRLDGKAAAREGKRKEELAVLKAQLERETLKLRREKGVSISPGETEAINAVISGRFGSPEVRTEENAIFAIRVAARAEEILIEAKAAGTPMGGNMAAERALTEIEGEAGGGADDASDPLGILSD
ncbi:MAG: hypothetical protein AAGI03_00755 [Pseudomonadota bacterium]